MSREASLEAVSLFLRERDEFQNLRKNMRVEEPRLGNWVLLKEINERSMAMKTSWADEKLLIGTAATSYGDLDSCIISDHPSVSIINTEKKNLSKDEINQSEHLQSLANQDYMEKIMELNDKLDMVKNIVRPGCSYEVLNTALHYMSWLATFLSKMTQHPHSSL